MDSLPVKVQIKGVSSKKDMPVLLAAIEEDLKEFGLLNRFRVFMQQPKWIHLECPGDACGLDPAYHSQPSLDDGMELVDHNCDTPLQQLTLLVGLIKIDELARRERSSF